MHAGGVLASASHSPSSLFFLSWLLPYAALFSKGPIALSRSLKRSPPGRPPQIGESCGKQVVEQETVGRRRRFSRVWILIPPRGSFGNVSIRRLKILLGLPGEKRTLLEKRERNPDGRQNDDGFLFATPRSGSEPSRLCAHIMKARHKRFIRSGQPRYEIRRFAEKEHSRLVRFGFSTPMS